MGGDGNQEGVETAVSLTTANLTTLTDIYLRWVSPSGLLGDEQLISNQAGDETHPRITLSLGNNLLILWQWGSGLYGLQADPDGQPFGRVFTLLDHPASQEQASIATTGSSHLLTWQDNQGTTWNTYAALFQPWQETVITYTYDPLYRLTAADYHGSLNANYQYQYDAVGNITQLTETVDGQTTTTTRTFNPANQLLTADDGQLDTTFGYDNAGNLVQKDTPATYETLWYRYDQRHLLIAAGSMSLGEIYTTTLITYDGAGHRLQLTQGGTTTTYTLDYAGGMRVLYEQGGAFADTKHYLYGLACIAELVNADDPNTKKWRYYHQDGQPLVRQTSDEQGHITLTWGYSPSGATLYGEEGPVTNLDCGATYDWGTGLIYKNGNYFDPNLQIWLSFAPLVVWQAWNSQQKKRHTSRKANNRRAILLLTLATLLLTAGCTSPGPLDPTATTLPTQTPTCTPTLPPPVIGQAPTNTPFPHPSTFTPFPTVTPVPPTIFPSVTPIYEQIPQPSNSIFPGTASIKGFGYSPSHLAIDVVPTANPDDAIGTPVYALAYGYLYRGDTSYQEVQPYQLSIKKIVSANPIQVSNAFEIGYSHVQPTRGEGIVQVGEQIGMIVDPKLDMANMHPDEYGDVLAHVHLSLRIEGVTKEPAPLLGNYLVPLPTPTP